jgi:RimJ/RimL family protein N-acetyltransferase
VFARARGITCVQGDTTHENIASQHVMGAVGMRLVAEDERLKYYKITWTDATAIVDLRGDGSR